MRLTNTDSWDDAKKFPLFATDEQLLKFINLDLKKAIPKSFSDFYLRAKNSATSQLQSTSDAFTTSFNTVKEEFTEISGTKIKNEDPSFTGASLALASFAKVYHIMLFILGCTCA